MKEFTDDWVRRGILQRAPTSEPKAFDVDAYVREQRTRTFNTVCPAEFQKKIDRALIRNIAAWDESDGWRGSFPGLWLWSPQTGMCKSRMLWKKYGELHLRGMTVVRITGLTLAEAYNDAYRTGATATFYNNLTHDRVAMLDDLDKMPLPNERDGFAQRDQAARNGVMLRELFDKFYEHHVPVLVTANEPIEWFEEKLGPSAARRMREVCRQVAFDL